MAPRRDPAATAQGPADRGAAGPRATADAYPLPPRAGLILAVVCLCQLMVVLDMTVVNVALPSIKADLGFTPNGLQWVVNAYTLTFGGLLLLGGVLTEYLDWRWVLFVNVPIAAVAVPLAATCIANLRLGSRPRLDVAGAVLATAAMVVLVYAVVRTDTYAWGSPQTLLGLALAVLLGVAFVVVQRRVPVPLVRLGILRHRSLWVSCVVIFLIACGQFGAFYFASLYLQGVLSYSPVMTGLAFVPFSVGVVVGTMVAGRLMPRVGARSLLGVGLGLAAIGMSWFGWVSSDGTFAGDILGPSLIASLGLGLCMVTNTAAGTAGVARHEAGLASGLLNSARQCGGSIGLAVLVTVATTVTRNHGGGPASRAALTAGYDRAFLVSGLLVAVAAFAVLALMPRATRRGARGGATA